MKESHHSDSVIDICLTQLGADGAVFRRTGLVQTPEEELTGTVGVAGKLEGTVGLAAHIALAAGDSAGVTGLKILA
jgi:hypothetical protein